MLQFFISFQFPVISQKIDRSSNVERLGVRTLAVEVMQRGLEGSKVIPIRIVLEEELQSISVSMRINTVGDGVFGPCEHFRDVTL